MISKNFFKSVTIAFIVIMLLSAFMIAIPALDDTVASARVTQAQIDRLRAEKREYERQKREVQAKIDTIEFEHMTEMSKKEVLDQRMTLTSLEINNINETINQFQLLIREKEYEVFLAQDREETQLQRYRNRVRDMEENGIITYLEIIFDSTSFSDLLARIDFVGDIMRSDERTYIDFQNARNETEAAKTTLEDTKAELDEEKIYLEVKEAELHEQLEEAQALILQLQADIETERQLHEQLVEEDARLQRQINAAIEQLRRQQEEAERLRRLQAQQAQQAGSSGGGGDASSDGGGSASSGGGAVSGSGSLMWPTSGRFGSAFGMRNGRMHQGIDIMAPHGTSIVAADSGTVVTVAYGRGWGNYVVISHGNGVSTLYSHMSSFSVSVGESVSKGQHIGGIGSTGNATTPHLHFEVIVNGSRVDPMTKL